MSRINTNIPSLVAQRVLGNNSAMLNQSLNRLSTGLRINSGKDDPAGLIASETLRSENTAINSALTNITRANNVIATAEGGLGEVNSLLTSLEDLVDRSSNEAGISTEERNANQLQIDAILASIDRFANTTEFQGKHLLNGELAYNTSGVNSANLVGLQVNSAIVPAGEARPVTVEITASAQVATVNYTGGTLASASVTVQVTGNLGSQVFTFASGTTTTDIAAAINTSKAQTGVSASVIGSAGNLSLYSTGFGTSQYVTVGVLDDAGNQMDASSLSSGSGGFGKDYGRNASVMINGSAAITDGLTASMRTSTLSLDVNLTQAFNKPGTTSFDIIGGGANFMISPTVTAGGIASLGIPSVSTGSLGKSGVGFLSELATGQKNALATGNYATAQNIVRDAEQQVAFLRGRLGAFQSSTLDPTQNSLQVTLENTTAAQSTIRDTDFASETANLTRAQVLVQSATATLKLANSAPQTALSLLQ